MQRVQWMDVTITQGTIKGCFEKLQKKKTQDLFAHERLANVKHVQVGLGGAGEQAGRSLTHYSL